MSSELTQPPDSWENSDIDERLKSLAINTAEKSSTRSLDNNSLNDAFTDDSPVPQIIPVSGENRDAISNKQQIFEIQTVTQIQGTGVSQKALEQVDSFLLEALQNPRDRITILRLEKEVERFMRNPSSQLLEFEPMVSSYYRLAAHRVAQHYFLQSQAVDVTIPERSRIIARKTSESRYPLIRLVDIPVNVEESSSANLSSSSQVVMLKQRPGNSRQGGKNSDSSSSSQSNLQKSVEERNEEYKRARARIFNNGGGDDDTLMDGLVSTQKSTEESSQNNLNTTQNSVSEPIHPKKNSEKKFIPYQTEYVNESNGSSLNEKDKEIEESSMVNKASSEKNYGGRRACVAIIRDREQDKMDPDYNRNYDRYSQRFDPGFGMQMPTPYNVHGVYTPVVNYNTEFPSLGPVRGQQHAGMHGNVRSDASHHAIHAYNVQQGLWPRLIRPTPTQYNVDQTVPFSYSSNQMSSQMMHPLNGQLGNPTGNQMGGLTGNQSVNLSVSQRGGAMTGNLIGTPSSANLPAIRNAMNPHMYYPQPYGMNNTVNFNSAHLQSTYPPYANSERFTASSVSTDIQNNQQASASRRN